MAKETHLPTSVPHSISPAVTYTSGAGVYGPGNLGQTSGLCNFAASHGQTQDRPRAVAGGIWRQADKLKPTHGSSTTSLAALSTAAWTPKPNWCRFAESEHRDW